MLNQCECSGWIGAEITLKVRGWRSYVLNTILLLHVDIFPNTLLVMELDREGLQTGFSEVWFWGMRGTTILYQVVCLKPMLMKPLTYSSSLFKSSGEA